MNITKFVACLCFLQPFISSYKSNPLFYNKHGKMYKDVSSGGITGSYIPFDINEMDIYERKYCGKSLNHLGGLLLDKTDKESKFIIEGSISNNNLILKVGKTKQKIIPIKKIYLPIETLSKKCIHIRETLDELSESSVIICLDTKFMRNFWINSITDAVLCNLTKLKGKLPEYNYSVEENEKEEETEKENEQIKETEKKEQVINEIREEQAKGESKKMTQGIYDTKSNEQTKDNEQNEMITKDNEQNEIMTKDNEQNEIITKNNEQNEIMTKNNEQNEIITKDNEQNEVKTEERTTQNEKYEELKKKMLREEYDEDITNEEKKKGVNVRISKGIYGYPRVKINGKSIDEIKKEQNENQIDFNESLRKESNDASQQTTYEME